MLDKEKKLGIRAVLDILARETSCISLKMPLRRNLYELAPVASYDTLDNITLSSSKTTYNLTKGEFCF